MNKIKVLIADDQEILLQNVIRELKQFNEFEVIGTANDGIDEYDKINNLKPDMIFTDNQMPNMTGIQVIEKIFEDTTIESKPYFAMITSDAYSMELRDKSKKYKFSLIPKPISKEGIQYALDEYLYFIENKDNNIEKQKEDNISANKEKKEFFSRLFKK